MNMALSPVYAAILQDLNKAVAHGQPEDVLQFCANWVSVLSCLSCPCPVVVLSLARGGQLETPEIGERERESQTRIPLSYLNTD